MNPKDPLNKTVDAQRELFTRFAAASNGFSIEQVHGAAAILILNAVRQAHPSQKAALDSFDEIFSKCRTLLADHYDGAGKRRNIFPFHQTIEMPLFNAKTGRNTVN